MFIVIHLLIGWRLSEGDGGDDEPRSVVEGGREGRGGGGDGVNSCGVGLLCNARAGRRADPALRRPPPPSAACTAAHIAARLPPALWWELGGMRWWRWWWLHVPNAVADMPSSIGDPIIPSSLSFTLRRLCPLHCQRCCGAPAPAPGSPTLHRHTVSIPSVNSGQVRS
ncbi:hypothetical protein B0H14DRAFT_2640988 [Mycena olivaceomarginata]|nr:hypothetical protein B0H14DRAFT_2640988 [Mycena olivaceomarginata]